MNKPKIRSTIQTLPMDQHKALREAFREFDRQCQFHPGPTKHEAMRKFPTASDAAETSRVLLPIGNTLPMPEPQETGPN